jgi:hypothetical protein
MNGHLILPTVLVLLIISCGNEKKQEKKNENVNPSISFEWNKVPLLKEKMLTQLREKKEPIDRILMNFLDEYYKTVDSANNFLSKQSNYDSLNTLAYSENGKVYQCALDFKEKVEKNGFKTASSEGMLYLSQRTDFIKNQTIELLDSISIEFLNLYCNEIDTICCDDASLVIPEKTLVKRIYNWGVLLDKVAKTDYKIFVESEFRRNLNLLYTGIENTPSFDRESKKYKTKLIDCMKEIIEQFPNSNASKEFKSFIDLLISENFERTEKINEFFKDKFK